ncbi:hypothetical protein ILUMI_24695 [Ignelater luminosus]|uniref:Peptidase S1 domain-containing protein n=1 Tax=Ignelater luminosus TaxID=2038154 RepID=A0A8K0CA04_IGNLU|nr:hypothetical protein ILUMI_24695 [Ignelater luminosus]
MICVRFSALTMLLLIFILFKVQIISGSRSTEDTVSPNQFPYVVCILLKKVCSENPMVYHCEGSIIGEYWTLTSVMCINRKIKLVIKHGHLLVRSKTMKCMNNDLPHKDHIIEQYFSEEDIKSGIALLKVQQSFDDFNQVRLLLPSPFQKLPDKTEITLAGWVFSPYAKLRIVKFRLIDIDECKTVDKSMQNHFLCAQGLTSRDMCLAYTGGAVVWNRIQIGIILDISMNDDNCYNQAAVSFPSVSSVVSWINDTIQHN